MSDLCLAELERPARGPRVRVSDLERRLRLPVGTLRTILADREGDGTLPFEVERTSLLVTPEVAERLARRAERQRRYLRKNHRRTAFTE